MIWRLATLLGGTLALWLAMVYPAFVKWGESAVFLSAAAAVLCLVPTTLTLLWAFWAQDRAPEQQMLMVLGGTGLRMFVVLSVGLVLSKTVEYFQEQNPFAFWGWVLVFYLFTLLVEVVLLLVGQSSVKHS